MLKILTDAEIAVAPPEFMLLYLYGIQGSPVTQKMIDQAYQAAPQFFLEVPEKGEEPEPEPDQEKLVLNGGILSLVPKGAEHAYRIPDR